MPKIRKVPHVLRRGNNYHAVLEIPVELRAQFGKRRFMATCGTDSLSVAGRRAAKYVKTWKREIAEARGAPIEALDETAFWRKRLAKAKDNKQRDQILERIEDAAYEVGMVHVDRVGTNPLSAPEASEFFDKATGAIVPFTEHLEEWLATSRVTPKTIEMQRSDIKRFARRFKTVQDTTRPEVRRWVSALMNDDGLTPKTVQRQLSALRGYWRYLQSIGVAGESEEPFDRLAVARQNKSAAAKVERKPFDPADVLKLIDEAGEGQLADLIMLAAYTGARRSELCALRTEHVKTDHFKIVASKSSAGVRDVPIHAKLVPVFARLVKQSKDGYVLSGLSANGLGDRGDAIGKKFTRLKRAMGYGPELVFHSTRKTVITQFENAGVPENVVADIVGHEKPTLTFGLYSGGVSLAVKKKAMAKLRY